MYPVSAGFLTAVATNHHYARRVTILDELLRPLEVIVEEEPDVVRTFSGNVQVGSGLIRRQLALDIDNSRGAFTPDPDGLIWAHHPILVEFGVWVDDGYEWVPVGTFYLDEPEATVGSPVLSLSGRDALSLIEGVRFPIPTTYPAGMRVRDVLANILFLGRITPDVFTLELDDGGAVLTVDHGYEVVRELHDAAQQLTIDHALDLRAAPDPGRIVCNRIPDFTTQKPVATWARGREVRLLGFKKKWRNRAANYARVEGEAPDGTPIAGEAFDLNPESPVYLYRPGTRILPVYWSSTGITDEEQCQRVARSLLVKRGYEEQIDASVVVNPALERYDVVNVEEPDTNTSGPFRINTFPLPLAPGGHTITVQRVRSLDPPDLGGGLTLVNMPGLVAGQKIAPPPPASALPPFRG